VRAYSYSRVSSGKQTTGSGLSRQIALAETWAEKHGLQLDSSLQLSDAGKSAYKAKHLNGALGRFLQLAQSGQVEHGSVLLVEAIDRLSRQEPIDGLQDVILALVSAGVRIVTLEDGAEYSRETFADDAARLIVLVVKITEAHRYGKRLATRVGAAHLKREQDLQAGVPRSVGLLPFWVSRDEAGQLQLNERAATVELIYRLSEAGKGGHQIARELNDRGLLTAQGKAWSGVNVNRLFTKPAVCGELVFRGKTYPDFYPKVVSREQYEAAKHRRAQNPGRRGGFASADQMHWIGQGLTLCAECGGSLGVNSGTNRDGSRRNYLRCRRGQDNSCSSKGWRLDQATSYLISRLTRKALEVVLGERLDTAPLKAAVTETRVQLEAAEARLQSAEGKAVEAAQDPETDLALLKILSKAQTEAQAAVSAAEREHLAAQAAYQAASTRAQEIELPAADLSTAEGRKQLNAGLLRLGLKISADWHQQRWGMSLPGTEMVWSSFSPDSWLEFDWVGPPEELDSAAAFWIEEQQKDHAS
jgi:DNA invertase Pin-like site-specific DNA recombinase